MPNHREPNNHKPSKKWWLLGAVATALLIIPRRSSPRADVNTPNKKAAVKNSPIKKAIIKKTSTKKETDKKRASNISATNINEI